MKTTFATCLLLLCTSVNAVDYQLPENAWTQLQLNTSPYSVVCDSATAVCNVPPGSYQLIQFFDDGPITDIINITESPASSFSTPTVPTFSTVQESCFNAGSCEAVCPTGALAIAGSCLARFNTVVVVPSNGVITSSPQYSSYECSITPQEIYDDLQIVTQLTCLNQ